MRNRQFALTLGGALLLLLLFGCGIPAVAALEEYHYVTKWGGTGPQPLNSGPGPGEFLYARHIAVDSTGAFVYVADSGNNRIQKFTPTGTFLSQIGNRGLGADFDWTFREPYGVTVDATGNVYVADTYQHRVQVYSPTGEFVRSWGSPWSYDAQLPPSGFTGDGEFCYPTDVAVDGSGYVYVIDNHRIQKFTPTGDFILKWGSEGSGDGQFVDPVSIAVDPVGNVYVAERSGKRIQVFDPAGNFIRKWGGTDELNSLRPSAIDVDSSGNVYVTGTIGDGDWMENGHGMVTKYTPTGTLLASWDLRLPGEIIAPYTYRSPCGVTVDGAGNVYVTENSNSQVMKFAPGPAPIIARDDSYATDEDTALSIAAGTGVLSNDLFIRDTSEATVVGNPSHGSLLLSADGSFTYTPAPNYHGIDTFSYAVVSGPESSDPATVTITVNDVNGAPIVSAGDDCTVSEGASITFSGGFTDDGAAGTHAIAWDFGDGETASGTLTPSHAYAEEGTYTVTLTVTDGEMVSTSDSFLVSVANVAPDVSMTVPADPVALVTSVPLVLTVADPGITDVLTATWNWGDGTIETGTLGRGSTTVHHNYAAPGLYGVTLTVDDGDEGSDTATGQTIVVYDPNGGYVTGKGQIDSPTGAYLADPTLSGKATFGFVSKYKRGATVPTGTTEFQFDLAQLDFRSDAYDWLVVAGARGQFKGTGTINGAGVYGFMVTAKDGDFNRERLPDTFRIKIWDKGTGAIVYDNMVGADDSVTPTTVLGKGSIMIHG